MEAGARIEARPQRCLIPCRGNCFLHNAPLLVTLLFSPRCLPVRPRLCTTDFCIELWPAFSFLVPNMQLPLCIVSRCLAFFSFYPLFSLLISRCRLFTQLLVNLPPAPERLAFHIDLLCRKEALIVLSSSISLVHSTHRC